MPVKVAARYQINMALGNLKNIANAEKFSDMFLPMLWMEIVRILKKFFLINLLTNNLFTGNVRVAY